MLNSRGYDANEFFADSGISRSSSAPPTNEEHYQKPYEAWQVWAPPTSGNSSPTRNDFFETSPQKTAFEGDFFAPRPKTAAPGFGLVWDQPNAHSHAGRPASANPYHSITPTTPSDYRPDLDYRTELRTPSPGFGKSRMETPSSYKSASVPHTPIYNSNEEYEDTERMMSVLSVIDSKEELMASPVPRASSTPPSRLFDSFEEEDYSPVLGLANTSSAWGPAHRKHGFPEGDEYRNRVGFLDEYSQGQPQNNGYAIHRPASASAQPRYRQPAPAFVPSQDPNAIAQAFAVLSAAGTLSPEQIAQLQLQMNTPPRQTQPEKRKVATLQTQQRPYNGYAAGPLSAPVTRPRNEIMTSPTSENRSAFLEEFRSNKNKRFELMDIMGNVVEFSGDQHGSRFIQQKLESASDDESEMVFGEILPHVVRLMTDVFGNYVIQKFFEYGSEEQKRVLADRMKGQVLSLSLQMYGCRVVQKALEYLPLPCQITIAKELEGHVLKCVKDQNGNHVIQKAIERIPPNSIRFIIDSFHGHIYALATHPYGCRVIQRIFEHCSDVESRPLLEELHRYAMSLIQDQYGNYVIQHILEKGGPADREFIISKVRGQIMTMSKHKFASNVVEKCVLFGTPRDRQDILDEIAVTKPDGTTPLFIMMKDQFANYVVQKILDSATESQRIMLVSKMKPQLPSLKKFTYGKHLITKVEKYVGQYNIE